ncbi:hypothetical protein SAMN05444143_103229 [Flavobacterium succinicans]|uniref:Uncharacterized protein n=1 Tax=Flavobacterium succinicans TaxID=29536 RepID=A0A1I4ULY7_9FLAO|nr:hypothetical protein [Flavobacterium succinicans]SFM89935.1 hypothetical protein SAMN05444143_103229 [Flavobacterium succinicans]
MKNLTKKITTLFALSIFTISTAQNYKGEIVDLENKTSTVEIVFNASSFNVNRLINLQEKITVVQNGTQVTYSPKNLKGFTIELEKETVKFESVDESIFAQTLYSNRIKLYKILRQISRGHIVRIYGIKKPNITKIAEMPAMGLSRLITKKEMLPAIEDCKISYTKIENDEIKIKDELILVDFIKDYEKNCF